MLNLLYHVHKSLMSNFNSEPRKQQEPRASSAFQWPSPSDTALLYSDISIKDILDAYQHDVELLKVILLAKAEEDKVSLRHIDLDLNYHTN